MDEAGYFENEDGNIEHAMMRWSGFELRRDGMTLDKEDFTREKLIRLLDYIREDSDADTVSFTIYNCTIQNYQTGVDIELHYDGENIELKNHFDYLLEVVKYVYGNDEGRLKAFPERYRQNTDEYDNSILLMFWRNIPKTFLPPGEDDEDDNDGIDADGDGSRSADSA